jgi:Mlc titration factor MtfA (ptsG expression regulator)
MVGLVLIFVIVITLIVYKLRRKREIQAYRLPAGSRSLLEKNVPFYRALDKKSKAVFEERVRDFLANVSVRGVDVEIKDLDKLLVASGAIIPIFSFPDWKYNNIAEVLLYNGAFNADYSTEAEGRNILGMVGDGAMHRNMIISLPALRSSFQHGANGHNTIIHEFVHLIDKADGSTDGVPEYLLATPAVIPWLKKIRANIQAIRQAGRSDIDRYAATNEAEFFAVISEYFFEQPDKLRAHHPDLYAMLEEMFHPHQLKE